MARVSVRRSPKQRNSLRSVSFVISFLLLCCRRWKFTSLRFSPCQRGRLEYILGVVTRWRSNKLYLTFSLERDELLRVHSSNCHGLPFPKLNETIFLDENCDFKLKFVDDALLRFFLTELFCRNLKRSVFYLYSRLNGFCCGGIEYVVPPSEGRISTRNDDEIHVSAKYFHKVCRRISVLAFSFLPWRMAGNGKSTCRALLLLSPLHATLHTAKPRATTT